MHEVEALLRAAVGGTVVRVRRGHYVAPGGGVDSQDGFIELWFDGGRCYRMGVTRGHRLAIDTEPWADGFLPPLTPENEEWVREHGKWTFRCLRRGRVRRRGWCHHRPRGPSP